MLYFTRKIVDTIKWFLLSFSLVICIVSTSLATEKDVQEDTIVQNFYLQNHQQLFWFSSEENLKKAADWVLTIEMSEKMGIMSDSHQISQIRTALLNYKSLDTVSRDQSDRQLTGIVLNFIKVLQEGNIKFDYDEISLSQDTLYISQLRNTKPYETVSEMVARLECKDYEYLVLKKFLNDSVASTDYVRSRKISLAMNYRRYFSVNRQPERIVVNIPETQLRYYQNDFMKLAMKAVVGKKLTPTPTIASYITDIVTFPHWNVPHSIAVKEILPKVQKSENYLEQNGYEVVNAKGRAVDDSELNWKGYNEENFPYFFRQATGSRNALGILKFDLKNPFSIFLHATSWQGAFDKEYRFLSHGCIRLENPFVLADRLLRGEINIKKLKNSKKNTQPKTIVLPQKVPVFIIYNPVIVARGKVVFLPDTYGLIK